jgi:hypothetical protein
MSSSCGRTLAAVIAAVVLIASPAHAAAHGGGHAAKAGGSRTHTAKSARPHKPKEKKDKSAQPARQSRKAPGPRAPATRASTIHHSNRCENCDRDEHAKILRSGKAKKAFERATGYPHGRPGFVIDHIRPLACGGLDLPSNMQWQTKADAKAKDNTERASCS